MLQHKTKERDIYIGQENKRYITDLYHKVHKSQFLTQKQKQSSEMEKQSHPSESQRIRNATKLQR
jgi:hypothetical protein